VVKRKGALEDGIAFMRSFEVIIIHPRCVHTAQEFRLCSYKRNRISGDVQPDLEDSSNHCIDVARYALAEVIHQRLLRRQMNTKLAWSIGR